VRAVRYAAGEALRSVWRRRGVSAMAALTAAVSLFVLGMLLLAGGTMAELLARWSAAAEFSVFLSSGVAPAERDAIERAIGASGVAAGQTYVPADEALRRFSQQFPDLSAAARSLPVNPLPPSYEVQLRAELARDPAVDRLAERLRQLPGVSDVRYDRRWIERLLGVVATVRTLGLGLVAVLALASCLTITAVVRLALHARRAEIEIMQLVGAPLAYIRGPFVVEGTLLGVTGAVIALALLLALYLGIREPLVTWASGVVDVGDVGFLSPGLMAALLAGGAVIGCLGGALASRAAR
jgi:cell division transport system permease protein